MFLGVFFHLPALALAIRNGIPLDKRCDAATTLAPPVTLTSFLPTQTYGPQHGLESACSMTYTTVLPSLVPGSGNGSPGGLRPCTYTVTYGCDGSQLSPCYLPNSEDICPPGFMKTTTICDSCGDSPITYTLTVLDPASETARDRPGYEEGPTTRVPTACGNGACTDSDNVLGGAEGQGSDSTTVDCGETSGLSECIEAAGPGNTGGTGDQVSRPNVDNEGSEEHIEVSAGANAKWLAETLIVPVILAVLNIPL